MNQVDDRQDDKWLREIVSEFNYPPTPDIAAAVEKRLIAKSSWQLPRWQPVWILLGLLLAGALLMAVPQVRAAVLEVLRAGGITIFVGEPTPPADVPATERPPATPAADTSEMHFLVAVTPVALGTAHAALSQPNGLLSESTVAGAPDEVYVDRQEDAEVAIFVWRGDDGRRYTLYAIVAVDFAYKQAEAVATATVGDAEAFWVEGPHGFALRRGDMWDWEMTSGAVLIWTEGALTYRLEGATTREEAQQFAESLQ